MFEWSIVTSLLWWCHVTGAPPHAVGLHDAVAVQLVVVQVEVAVDDSHSNVGTSLRYLPCLVCLDGRKVPGVVRILEGGVVGVLGKAAHHAFGEDEEGDVAHLLWQLLQHGVAFRLGHLQLQCLRQRVVAQYLILVAGIELLELVSEFVECFVVGIGIEYDIQTVANNLLSRVIVGDDIVLVEWRNLVVLRPGEVRAGVLNVTRKIYGSVDRYSDGVGAIGTDNLVGNVSIIVGLVDLLEEIQYEDQCKQENEEEQQPAQIACSTPWFPEWFVAA